MKKYSVGERVEFFQDTPGRAIVRRNGIIAKMIEELDKPTLYYVKGDNGTMVGVFQDEIVPITAKDKKKVDAILQENNLTRTQRLLLANIVSLSFAEGKVTNGEVGDF